ncbi:AcvB/VirJ family lysyl-phosphatidylglycerol hydrolase [Sphingomonas sp. CJ20]
MNANPSWYRRMLRRWKAWVAGLVAVIAIGLVVLYASAGFFDRDPVRLFGMEHRGAPVAALYFSGDMGLRYGMGPYIAAGLADAGVPVLGVSSSTAFATHRTRAETDAIFAKAVRDTLRQTGAQRVILIGQSYGADITRVGLASLPADLRAKVAAAVLVVPGRTAYFRADPAGFAYRGTPDAGPEEANRIDWLPLTCIRGALEPDSLCPVLTGGNVRSIVLPGGHFLNNDHDLLVRTVLTALTPQLSAGKEPRQ